jgi:hypothetical protein
MPYEDLYYLENLNNNATTSDIYSFSSAKLTFYVVLMLYRMFITA